MLDNIRVENFGPIRTLEWNGLGPLNLVIGPNGCGKSWLLKALYCIVRTTEQFGRGDDTRSLQAVLHEKLHWTYQSGDLPALVHHRDDGRLLGHGPAVAKATLDGSAFEFGITNQAPAGGELTMAWEGTPRTTNSTFFPSHEVLSLNGTVLKSREVDVVFGFDDTAYELAKALAYPRRQAPAGTGFTAEQHALVEVMDGRFEYKGGDGFTFVPYGGAPILPARFAAEGIRKLGMLERLLANGYLSPGSIVFIDEPEASLHPTAITAFLDVIAALSRAGIQFVIASHSYFVIKKLHLIARATGVGIPVLSADREGRWHAEDLSKGLPDNPIIAESVRLYEEELDLALQ